MSELVLRAETPRLVRLLAALGVDVRYDPAAPADVSGPGGATDLVSKFAFHQLREALAVLGADLDDLTPTSGEGRAWQAILRALADAPRLEGMGEPDAELPVLEGLEGALDVHQAIEVALVTHRLAVMRVDLDAARRTWAEFTRIMLHHVIVEDTLVTPRYVVAEPAEGWERGAAPSILANEHGKIRSKLEEFSRALDELAGADLGHPERAARCLELLDRQKIFADLLEHHDLRERAFVYPRLEQILDPAQKAEIVAGLLAW